MNLRERSDEQLLHEVGRLIGNHRALTARLVAYLGEIENRRLHLQAGFSSMFEFCVRELGLSEGEAFRRILAGRLVRRFPAILDMIASGAVHLSVLELVRERLTDENHAELLRDVSGKSKREVEALLAARFPRPDVPSRIVRARIEPLSEAHYRVEFTASAELREKLELCRDLMSHANPTRDLGVVVERAVDLLLAELQKARLGHAKRPRQETTSRATKPGYVTRAARRHVYERDGTHCTYVSPEGRRCNARTFLELDHAEPRGLGGGDDAENLRPRCRAHNQLWAEQAYGRELVERRRRFRQQKCTPKTTGERGRQSSAETTASVTWEKVLVALKGMGFRATEARDAVAYAQKMARVPTTVEEALREALLVATRKPAGNGGPAFRVVVGT